MIFLLEHIFDIVAIIISLLSLIVMIKIDIIAKKNRYQELLREVRNSFQFLGISINPNYVRNVDVNIDNELNGLEAKGISMVILKYDIKNQELLKNIEINHFELFMNLKGEDGVIIYTKRTNNNHKNKIRFANNEVKLIFSTHINNRIFRNNLAKCKFLTLRTKLAFKSILYNEVLENEYEVIFQINYKNQNDSNKNYDFKSISTKMKNSRISK